MKLVKDDYFDDNYFLDCDDGNLNNLSNLNNVVANSIFEDIDFENIGSISNLFVASRLLDRYKDIFPLFSSELRSNIYLAKKAIQIDIIYMYFVDKSLLSNKDFMYFYLEYSSDKLGLNNIFYPDVSLIDDKSFWIKTFTCIVHNKVALKGNALGLDFYFGTVAYQCLKQFNLSDDDYVDMFTDGVAGLILFSRLLVHESLFVDKSFQSIQNNNSLIKKALKFSGIFYIVLNDDNRRDLESIKITLFGHVDYISDIKQSNDFLRDCNDACEVYNRVLEKINQHKRDELSKRFKMVKC